MTLKKAMTTSSILVAALWVALVGGCGETQRPQDGSDSDLQGDNLNGGGSQGSDHDGDPQGRGEEDDDEGTSSGGAGGKVTLCHIPPGNPSRAHTLIVGEPAVRAHLMHGDTLGPCEGSDAGTSDPDGGTTEPDAGSGEPDAGSGEPDAGSGEPDAGSGEPDAGPVCVPSGFECRVDVPCCSGLQCSAGRCTVIIN
jgi:hypothetical protein